MGVLNWVKMVKKLKTMKQKKKPESNLNIRTIPLYFWLPVESDQLLHASVHHTQRFFCCHPFLTMVDCIFKQENTKISPFFFIILLAMSFCYNSKIVTNTENQWLASEFGKNNCNVLVVNCLRIFSQLAEKTFSRCSRKSLCQPDTR